MANKNSAVALVTMPNSLKNSPRLSKVDEKNNKPQPPAKK